jgi:hypothetical protein
MRGRSNTEVLLGEVQDFDLDGKIVKLTELDVADTYVSLTSAQRAAIITVS